MKIFGIKVFFQQKRGEISLLKWLLKGGGCQFAAKGKVHGGESLEGSRGEYKWAPLEKEKR